MFVLFFLLWMILNGRLTGEVILFGLGVSALITLFLRRCCGWSRAAERRLLRACPLLGLYFLNLLWETVKAAVTVGLFALTPGAHPEPVLVEFRSGLPGEALNVLLANSITLTPGTITVFQERDRFLVHALRREYAEGLEESSFVRILRRFPHES